MNHDHNGRFRRFPYLALKHMKTRQKHNQAKHFAGDRKFPIKRPAGSDQTQSSKEFPAVLNCAVRFHNRSAKIICRSRRQKCLPPYPPPSPPDFRARIVPSFVTASFSPLYLRPFFSILSFSFFLLSFLFLRPSFLLPSPFSSSSCASSASSSSHSPSLSPPLLYDQVTSKLVSCLITFPTNIPLHILCPYPVMVWWGIPKRIEYSLRS